jgi:surface polysaccharide O-acyltransferase-like enzyme
MCMFKRLVQKPSPRDYHVWYFAFAFPLLLLLLLLPSIQHGMKRGLYNAVRDIAELSIIGTWSALLGPVAIEL